MNELTLRIIFFIMIIVAIILGGVVWI